MITVYSQPGCAPCRATVKRLDRLGVEYTAVDVTTDPASYEHIIAEGFTATPVVEVTEGGEVVAAWSGFKFDALTAAATPGGDVAAHDMRGQ